MTRTFSISISKNTFQPPIFTGYFEIEKNNNGEYEIISFIDNSTAKSCLLPNKIDTLNNHQPADRIFNPVSLRFSYNGTNIMSENLYSKLVTYYNDNKPEFNLFHYYPENFEEYILNYPDDVNYDYLSMWASQNIIYNYKDYFVITNIKEI